MPKSKGIGENLSLLVQVVRRGNIEMVGTLAMMSFVIIGLYLPAAARQKVLEQNRDVLANSSEDDTEEFLKVRVTSLNMFHGLLRLPLEILIGPLYGT